MFVRETCGFFLRVEHPSRQIIEEARPPGQPTKQFKNKESEIRLENLP